MDQKKKAEIITPALTIFDDEGKIDYAGNARLIEHLISHHVDGILPLGSSGEFNKFSTEEKKAFAEFYLKTVDGRVKVLVGTGCIKFDETVELSNFALSRGADGVLILGELYFKMSEEDFFHYYDGLCKAIRGAVYIYNYPVNTGNNISAKTISRLLKENHNLAGIKDTVPDFSHTKDILELVSSDYPDFKVYSGFDNQFTDNVKYRGAGNISAISNIAPDLWSGWVEAYNKGDQKQFEEVEKRIGGLMELYTLDSNLFHVFKCMLKYTGLDINTTTLFPFDKLSDEQIVKGQGIIDQWYQR